MTPEARQSEANQSVFDKALQNALANGLSYVMALKAARNEMEAQYLKRLDCVRR